MGTSEGRIVTIPASSNRSLRSLTRTSLVSRPSWSSRSSVPTRRAPRGTAIRRSDTPTTLLPGKRDVHALDVQSEADSGQRTPEGSQELVVAAAASNRHAVGRVVDLKDRSRVIAQAAHQPEVEDDPAGDVV